MDKSINHTPSGKVTPMSSGKMHTSAGGAKAGNMVNTQAGKQAMPTVNGSRPASHPSRVLGSTKHGVGEVPAYLKGK